MTTEKEITQVAMKAGESMIIHADGNPAQVMAMGVAAAVAVFCRWNRLRRILWCRLLEWFDGCRTFPDNERYRKVLSQLPETFDIILHPNNWSFYYTDEIGGLENMMGNHLSDFSTTETKQLSFFKRIAPVKKMT